MANRGEKEEHESVYNLTCILKEEKFVLTKIGWH